MEILYKVSSDKVSELTSGTRMYRQNAKKTAVFAAFWSKTSGFARVLRSEKVQGGTFSDLTKLKNNALWFVVLVVSGMIVNSCGNDGTADGGAGATVLAEETIHNPLFPSEKTVQLKYPSHEVIVAQGNLAFRLSGLSGCGSYLKVIVASERMIVSKGTIADAETILLAERSTHDLSDSEISASEFVTSSGDPFVFSSGSFYWAAWTYNEYGEIACSSPQYIFYVRE